VIYKKSNIFLLSLLFFSSTCSQAEKGSKSQYSFYIGALGGYSSTTWQGLVATEENQSAAMMLSTPIKVDEGGAAWGFLAGYEFNPFFAFEANYMRYPDAKVTFDSTSLFCFNHNGQTVLNTLTETLSMMGKVMLYVPHTKLRIYSSAGAANVHREDIVVNDWRLSPTFGVGVNYHVNERLTAEIGGNYTAGFGESQLNPAETYFPFLYSITLRLGYYF